MKIKHHEILPIADNPFTECKLGREPYAKILTEIVNTYADGFVLAINNEWGTGKTTFVKMWEQHLKNEGFQTIYFNAWENDFDNNPLIAIMSELETLTNTKNKKIFKSVVEKGAVLAKNVAPAILKAIANRYMDSEVIAEAIKNVTKASTEILEEEIKEYTSKKKTIKEFRKELEKFVKQAENTKPLIFIVDELDRCRPNYAVEVLEQIKHFFTVPGIVFVLSIDKKHLGAAVRGFYGSEQIDSNEYLRRFIDLEYSIPSPQIEHFVKYLFEYYGFNEFFKSDERVKYSQFREDKELLLITAELLFTKSNATLRQQERVFALSRLILCSFKSNQYTFPLLFFALIFLKTMNNDLYLKIERNELTLVELSEAFYNLVYSPKIESLKWNFLYMEALLLWFYNNDQKSSVKINLLEKDDSGNMSTNFRSKLEGKSGHLSLVECFNKIKAEWDYDDIELSYLIKKINLTKSIVIQ